jgi:hypothetical protein
MRRFAIPLAMLCLALAAGPATADSVYHTQRLILEPVGDAPGSGMVVNIHPNGPVVFATERYGLRVAEPNSRYTVWLVIDASQLDECKEDGVTILTIAMKADLQTNVAGNGTSPADFFFHPGDIPPCLRNESFPIHWEVTLEGSLTHVTESTTVTLD